MNPLFVDILVLFLLFLVVLACGWVHVLKERVSRLALVVEAQAGVDVRLNNELADVQTNLPKVKLMELQELFGALKSEFDGVLVENDAFRQKCTNQMQRFDSIMRRNKAVLAKGGRVQAVAEAGDSDIDDEDDGPLPQRFLAENPAALQQPATTTGLSPGVLRDERRTAMRKKWKENRGL